MFLLYLFLYHHYCMLGRRSITELCHKAYKKTFLCKCAVIALLSKERPFLSQKTELS